MFDRVLNKINPIIEYRPREIAEHRWIKPPRGNDKESAYHFILRLIARGFLKADDKSGFKEKKSKVPHYTVLGAEIIRYRKQIYG